VACCRSREAGYATPLALVVALALSLVSVAMVTRSTMLLRQARADLDRARAEHALDGAQLEAAASIIRSGAGSAYRWALATDVGWTEVVAESEREKLSLAAAADLPDATLERLGVTDPAGLKVRLTAAAAADRIDVAALDDALLWRACAPAVMSGLGARQALTWPVYAEPSLGQKDPAWRVGEAWRVRITTSAGWRDDRIVRFTGDARHPVAVVARRLSRSDGGQNRCDAIMAAAG